MLVFFLIILLLFSVVSLFFSIKIINVQLKRISTYEEWIQEFKQDVQVTYNTIQALDDKQMFKKDDDVGVIFQDMLNIIKKLNDRTE